MPWLIARYLPVGLFSLKDSQATSTGGKSLLVPSPFAIRVALMDAALRAEGVKQAEAVFRLVQHLKLALRPPAWAAVSGLLVKVLKPKRADSAKAADRFFQKTIAFREYVHWQGELALAFGGEPHTLARVSGWLPHVTYLGKRGGFIQLQAPPRPTDTLPESFIPLSDTGLGRQSDVTFRVGLVQRLDDWGPSLTWEKLNIYSEAKIRPGKDRIAILVSLPYHMDRAGRGFSVYRVS